MLIVALLAGRASADESCIDFHWDVAKERALFATAPALLAAGAEVKSAPSIHVGQLVRLKLQPVTKVTYKLQPGRGVPNDGGHAGLVLLKVPADGEYRVSLDVPVWVDMVEDGTLLMPTDYQGQHECPAPHKIVVWQLKGSSPLVIQMSATTADTVLVSVTPVPARVR
jgi:hypothetical protein